MRMCTKRETLKCHIVTVRQSSGIGPKISLGCKMLALVLTLCALAACARADCDACVAGLCHSRRPVVSGFTVTDQLAIDRTNNVLYLQFNNYINTAIFLDDRQSRLVNMMWTSGMTVNQETGDLYLGTTEVNNTYYMYNLVSNKTEAVNIIKDHNKRPHLMFYANNHLHFINKNKKHFFYYNMTAKEVWHYKNFDDYLISDFVIGENKKMFFVSNDTVQVFDSLDPSSPGELVVIGNNHVLSVDKYDNVYFADVTEKVIYIRDKTTVTLETYVSYKSDAIEDYVFDKDNRIVFRDAAGVAQWVPAAAHKRCAFDPQGGFLMKVV